MDNQNEVPKAIAGFIDVAMENFTWPQLQSVLNKFPDKVVEREAVKRGFVAPEDYIKGAPLDKLLGEIARRVKSS
jgi:hypothetical protein